MKFCPKCKLEKPINDFGNCTREKDGKNYICKACANEKTRKSYYKNIDKHRERNRKRRIRPPEYHKKRRNTRMFLIYGITEQDYEEMLTSQNGVCRICKGNHSKISFGKLVIDHDHKTNRVRGLICGDCNVMIGNAKDSIDILSSAIEYLKSEPTRFMHGRKKKYKNK